MLTEKREGEKKKNSFLAFSLVSGNLETEQNKEFKIKMGQILSLLSSL